MTETSIVHVVDADSSVRRSLKRLISSFGINVRTFASVDEYTQAGPATDNACLIIDSETAKQSTDLKETLSNHADGVKVIVITVSDGQAARKLAMALDAVICLQKPVDDQALLDSIRWCFGLKS